jgi:hypothetical protein
MGGEGCLTNSTSHLSKSLSTTQYVILSRMESKVHQSSDSPSRFVKCGVPRFLRALCARGGRRRRTNVLVWGGHSCPPICAPPPTTQGQPLGAPHIAHFAMCGFRRPERMEITLTPRGAAYSSHLLQKSYSNPRVKWRTQHPHLRKERECVGHPASVSPGSSF